MGLRFRKSIKIAPGVKLNLGKKGVGVSVGTKGYRYSVNTSGRRTTTVGIPGTGLSYSHSTSGSKSKRSHSSGSSHKSTSSYSSLTQEIKRAEKIALQESYSAVVEEYCNYIHEIQSVHQNCTKQILWNTLSKSDAPFELGTAGPAETAAIEMYNNFKPSFFEKIFKNNGDERRKELENKIETAKLNDIETYRSWEETVSLANRVLDGDIDSYYEVIETQNPFSALAELGSGFEFGTDSPDSMEIEFTVKSEAVIPTESKSLTKTGKLSVKNLSKTNYYDITQDYVCSCSIRLARELFALLPIEIVIVHACDNILDTNTGNDKDETILSIRFTKDGFKNINFEKIDASDFVETFEHNMTFKKTAGFKPVERLK